MKKSHNVQVMIDEDTFKQLSRLILIEAVETGEPVKGRSQWVRELIEDTVSWHATAAKIKDWDPKRIKELKPKNR